MKKNDLNAKPDASMSNNLMKIFLFEDRPGGGSRTQPVVITQAPQKQGPFIRKMMNVYQSPQNADLELGCDVLKDDKICSQKVEEEIKENIWEENDEESLREVMVVENLDSDDDYLDSKKVDKNSLDKKSPTLESCHPFFEIYDSMRRFICWPALFESSHAQGEATKEEVKPVTLNTEQSSKNPTNLDDNLYKCETKIENTSNGVRITTQIFNEDNPGKKFKAKRISDKGFTNYVSETRVDDKFIHIQLPRYEPRNITIDQCCDIV